MPTATKTLNLHQSRTEYDSAINFNTERLRDKVGIQAADRPTFNIDESLFPKGVSGSSSTPQDESERTLRI